MCPTRQGAGTDCAGTIRRSVLVWCTGPTSCQQTSRPQTFPIRTIRSRLDGVHMRDSPIGATGYVRISTGERQCILTPLLSLVTRAVVLRRIAWRLPTRLCIAGCSMRTVEPQKGYPGWCVATGNDERRRRSSYRQHCTRVPVQCNRLDQWYRSSVGDRSRRSYPCCTC
jgi:hypothetical protein